MGYGRMAVLVTSAQIDALEEKGYLDPDLRGERVDRTSSTSPFKITFSALRRSLRGLSGAGARIGSTQTRHSILSFFRFNDRPTKPPNLHPVIDPQRRASQQEGIIQATAVENVGDVMPSKAPICSSPQPRMALSANFQATVRRSWTTTTSETKRGVFDMCAAPIAHKMNRLRWCRILPIKPSSPSTVRGCLMSCASVPTI
jgi:hypothetical protein